MNQEMIDQTAFLQDPMTSEVSPVSSPILVRVKPNSKRPFILVGIGASILLGLAVLGVVSRTRRANQAIVTVTPTPSSVPVESSGIRAEIAPFLQTIETLNPESDENPFPPVHFDVRIKEPGSR